MDSDDEWIAEQEDSVLPMETSWMDIYDIFNETEESVKGVRKKRGNSNT